MSRSLNSVIKPNNGSKIIHYDFFILLVFVLIFLGTFSYLSIRRYDSFVPSAFDMGVMIQTVWNTSQGWFMQESINMGYPMIRFWVAHWEFIYFIIALFYKIFSTPYILFIFQATVVASGAIPIFYLAEEKINNRTLAFIFSLSYLFYPAMHNAVLFDIHGITLAAPFLIYTFYFLQKGNYKLFFLFGFIALICREDSALVLFMIGLYAFFILKEKKIATFTICISLVYFGIWYNRISIRSIIGLPDIVLTDTVGSHYDHLSQIKENPFYLMNHLAKKYNIRYLISLLGPVVFLSVFSPSTFLIALPIFSINLLSDFYFTHGIEHHYSALIIPFIFISGIYGTKNVLMFLKKKYFVKRDTFQKFIVPLICFFSLLFFLKKSNVFDAKKWSMTEHHITIKKVIDEIPNEASLSALNQFVPHAAERREVYVFDDRANDADYVLYDFYAPEVRLMDRSLYINPSFWPYNDRIKKILENREYGIVIYKDGVCLFEKGYDYEAGLQNLALAKKDEIDNYIEKAVNKYIIIKGHNLHPILKMWHTEEGIKGLLWDKQLHFTCFWTTEKDIQDTLRFVFKINNSDFQKTFDHFPVFRLYPTVMWNKNNIIKDEVFWEIPADMASGMYEVSVTVNSDRDSEITNKHFTYLFNIWIE